jgi:hypothetical protein
MPLIATRGAASAQGFGEFAQSAVVNYIEDVFSTYLYTGNNGTQSITNGINLTGKGGLVWIKDRTQTWDHLLTDSARGNGNGLFSNTTSASTAGYGVDLASNGFTLTSGDNISNKVRPYVSWTFREQAKFFDIVTYTGNGASSRDISHSLGSTPGFVIVKRTNTTGDWVARHVPFSGNFLLNSTVAADDATTFANGNVGGASSTTFNVSVGGTSGNNVNANGSTYVAYLFAHNAGGFGLTGSDNVISCGSYSGTGATGNAITLGYEAQWVMVKRTDTTGDWEIMDAMRSGFLEANTSDAESGGSWFSLSGDNFFPTATGFQINTAGPAWNASGGTYIYIAIRRGPMKVPTLGTSVFEDFTYSAGTAQTQNAGFNGDLLFIKQRGAAGDRSILIDRLRGYELLNAASTSAALTPSDFGLSNSSFPSYVGSNLSNYTSIPTGDAGWNGGGGNTYVDYAIARAPGFFDEVCYTGNYAGNPQIPHNLTVAPELIIAKQRGGSGAWYINSPSIGTNFQLAFNASAKSAGSTYTLTSTYFQNPDINFPTGGTFVAYLFATCAGVSKVGTYTGTGALQTVNCGFASGARFVLIKRTDSSGDWYTYDSARGISSGNDPYLFMNTTDTEFTGTNYVDTDTTGFKVTAAAPAGLNASGGTYIFLAIA